MDKKTIHRRYFIEEKLGSGGMGTVYRANDLTTSQTVAIKQLKPTLADAALIERFKREGEALRDLNHPNIVKMLDAVEEDGQHYLVMEFISGGDLSDLLQQGQLPLERILNILIDLADALTRAHRLNIIHRDLKPANILIGDDGILRLTDFGVAHVGSKARVTDTDAIVGTIDYLPPEAFDGGSFDERGDIWAFGVILFEMLIGKRPFAGKTIMQVMQSITTEPVPDIDELRPDIPVALIDLTYRMLERDVDARIRSVRQIGLELEDILHGRTTQIVQSVRFDVSESDIFAIKKHNLPVQSTPFVGREPELDELSKLIIDPSIRLITIIAPGGMGKTRLALEAAERNLDNFGDGVYFVELAPLSTTEQMVFAIANTLHLTFQQDGRSEQEQLLEFLQNKNLLLILDNFEHLLEGTGLVTEILQATNNVQILVTSRQRLAQQSENILHLGGMDFPAWETPEDAMQYAAVRLFVNSARRVQSDFELTSDNLDYVARICKLVQGMPLGIVLSGAWVEMLSPEEIARELEQSIDILSDELGELPERQQSIRAVMDYAWQMMSDAEQRVFMNLSIFKDGFTREAVQAVAGANLRLLMNLVTKSLLRRDTSSGRYQVHELLRQYAHEKLQRTHELEDTYHRHAEFYSEFIAQQLPHLKGGNQLKALNSIDDDYENCQAAWQWAVKQANTDIIDKMIDSLYLYLNFRYLLAVGYELFESARKQWSTPSLDVSLITGRLSVRFIETELSDKKLPVLEQGLAIAQHHNNLAEISFCEREIGILYGHHLSADPLHINKGVTYLESSLSYYQKVSDKFNEAQLWDDIAYCYRRLGDSETQLEFSQRSIDMRREVGDLIGLNIALSGYVSNIMYSDPEEASRVVEEMYDTGKRINNQYIMLQARLTQSTVFIMIGDLKRAKSGYLEGLAIAENVSDLFGRVVARFALASCICFLNENTEDARSYIDTALKLSEASLVQNDNAYLPHRSLAEMSYGVATGNYDLLLERLRILVNLMFPTSVNPNYMVIIGFTVPFYLHRGRIEYAIKLWGFVHNHPWTPSVIRLFSQWQPMIDWEKKLRRKLGNEPFEALFEAGKTLDLQNVIKEMIAYFQHEYLRQLGRFRL